VETPEQQRRPTIGQSAQKLRQWGLDFDAVDLADMFWLAQFIELEETARMEGEAQPPKKQTANGTGDVSATASNEPVVNLYIDDRQESPLSEQSGNGQSTTDETAAEKPKGIPFPVPAAPSLRTRLDLARALKPLMRKVPSQSRYELDEDATVTQIAETEMMIPVVRSQPERWLDLDLVVEDSKTTVIWERTIAELQHLMEYQGAFRAVRTWRLAVSNLVSDLQTAKPEDVQLFPRWQGRSKDYLSQRPRSPRELLDPGSRRLILFVTDCTSALWHRGIVHETLWQWAKTQPLSIVQLFPERLWTRTALSYGYRVRLGATAPGLPSARLEVAGLPVLEEWDEFQDEDVAKDSQERTDGSQERTDDKRRLVLPIVTLDPKAMFRWARVLSGGGDTLIPGRLFELKTVRQLATNLAASDFASQSVDARTARQRVALFKATALAPAQALAKCMAATPVSLPVIDLLRDEFVTEAQQEHVAEVLLSGLLQRVDEAEGDGACRYEFFGDREKPEKTERVRDLLLDDIPTAHTRSVLDRLAQLIKDKAGNTLKSFEAFLDAFEESGETLGAGALPLAIVGLDVLHRLGGPHAALARQYERVRTSQPGQIPPTENDFPLEDLEYEVATLISFPPLQPCEYQSATIAAILDRFDFETATIVQENSVPGWNRVWTSHRRPAVAWGYTELLTTETENPIGLDMIAIPAGSFTMGAPQSEPGSSGSERPQHEVTLQSFYLGRYPITQAQWRVVAGYEAIDRDLNPNPSDFEGDNRPVENVSWEDAQEFCQRLSARTGKFYCLPSEAQWEYACRAGTTTPFHFGETLATELANYDGDYTYNDGPKGEYRKQTTDVGTFPANEWGLHDVHGNVWEWCLDHWHEDYEGAPTNGSAWLNSSGLLTENEERITTESGDFLVTEEDETASRMLRGGSWYYTPRDCRSAVRINFSRGSRNLDLGFRVCCVPPRTFS
jgi:formylglycine-generating enzyme required for sulfatase activity